MKKIVIDLEDKENYYLIEKDSINKFQYKDLVKRTVYRNRNKAFKLLFLLYNSPINMVYSKYFLCAIKRKGTQYFDCDDSNDLYNVYKLFNELFGKRVITHSNSQSLHNLKDERKDWNDFFIKMDLSLVDAKLELINPERLNKLKFDVWDIEYSRLMSNSRRQSSPLLTKTPRYKWDFQMPQRNCLFTEMQIKGQVESYFNRFESCICNCDDIELLKREFNLLQHRIAELERSLE